MKPSKSAFTLIEILGAIAIVSLLVGVVVAFMPNLYEEAKDVADSYSVKVLNEACDRYRASGGDISGWYANPDSGEDANDFSINGGRDALEARVLASLRSANLLGQENQRSISELIPVIPPRITSRGEGPTFYFGDYDLLIGPNFEVYGVSGSL